MQKSRNNAHWQKIIQGKNNNKKKIHYGLCFEYKFSVFIFGLKLVIIYSAL